MFFAFAIWKLGSLPFPSKTPSKALSEKVERWLLALILGLGLFLRVFRLDSLPSGMHTDQGLMGMSALRIAFEGWRPFFEVFNYHVPEVGMYYQLAAWFKLVGSSYFTFHLFFALFSLATLPFVYWAFRQLSGPRIALLALFFLAIMRWNLIDSRNGFPTIQVPFYMFGTLAFWVYWLQKRKTWALVLSALFCGIGLYTYQSFKAVPFLMLILAIYEYRIRRKETRITRQQILGFFLLVGLVATPFIWYMAQQGSFGNREKALFILNEVREKKSLLPVVDHWFRTALMFNREGDANPRHNIPGYRMLDDITGLFFLLGLALAFHRRKERDSFYAISGLFVMSLPCLLSTDVAHSNRMLAVTPFVAFLAASSFDYFWRGLASLPRLKKQVGWATAVLLLFAGAQNAYTYFVVQAQTYPCWQGYGPEQNYIGRMIEGLEKNEPGKYDYFVTPAYFGNHTIAYLGYPAGNRLQGLHIPEDLKTGAWPSDRDTIFFLEEGKSGLLDFLKTILPGGEEERLKDRDGRTLIFVYKVPRGVMGYYQGWDRGLVGDYFNSLDGKTKPVAHRLDPVLNFTYKLDFPFQDYPPFYIRWQGQLVAPATGNYSFQILTTDWAEILLDGRKIFDTTLGNPAELKLTRGPHLIRVNYLKKEGDTQVFHMVWTRPGFDHWEVVPAAAFGILRR